MDRGWPPDAWFGGRGWLQRPAVGNFHNQLGLLGRPFCARNGRVFALRRRKPLELILFFPRLCSQSLHDHGKRVPLAPWVEHGTKPFERRRVNLPRLAAPYGARNQICR